MRYLVIENKVNTIPSMELLCMLGASASRGRSGKVGQFGSGYPNSLALLARKGLLARTKICLGLDVYTHTTKLHALKDSTGEIHNQEEIICKKQNGGTRSLNISTEFGEMDWDSITMAIREFISNALDGADSYNGSYDSVRVEVIECDEDARLLRAKDGHIRVYIPVNAEIEDYVKNIHKFFPCLMPDYDKNKRVIRNGEEGPARVYRKGVLVGEFGDNSLFHYNIENIDIDESRNVSEYTAQARCAEALAIYAKSIFIEIFLEHRLSPSKEVWEDSFSSWELNPDHADVSTAQKAISRICWEDAVANVIGDGVVCENETTRRMVEGKGLQAIRMPSTLVSLMTRYGAKSADKVLSQHEIDGREICEVPYHVRDVVSAVWQSLCDLEMTMGKDQPDVMGFHQNTIDGMLGYYRPGDSTIYVRSDIFDDHGFLLARVVLEEIGHYVSGAADYCKEFQDFAFKCAALLMVKQRSAN